MRHKGPVLRPRCIGPERSRTQIPFNSSFNMSAGPKHTRHFRAPCSLLYDNALMSAANMLLYLNPETVAYVFFRHHTQFHQRNFSSSKSVRIKHNTNSDTYFPLFLVGECLILIPAIIITFFHSKLSVAVSSQCY